MDKQYKKLFKPLSWWEKLFNTRVNKGKYRYIYPKYCIPCDWDLQTIFKEFYYPKDYKKVFDATFTQLVRGLKTELGYAIINCKISLEEIYNLFIKSKLVQQDIIRRIQYRQSVVEKPINEYKNRLEKGWW